MTMLSVAAGTTVWAAASTASAAVICDVNTPIDDVNTPGSLRYCVDQVNQGAADSLDVNPDWYELQAPLVFEQSATVWGHGAIVLPGDEFEGESLIEVGTKCPGAGCLPPATLDLQMLEVGAVGFGGVRGINVHKQSELIMWDGLVAGFEVATEGGCIRALAQSTVTIHGTRFEECKAADGGALWSEGVSTRLYDATFENNEATYNGGAVMIGSANFFVRALEVAGSEFVGNHANWGGAILASSFQISTTVDESAFYGNTADQFGGAFRGFGTFELCTFAENVAGKLGGALSLVYDSEVLDSTIDSNQAEEGGGVAFDGAARPLTVDGSTFVRNFAEAPDAGGGGGLLVLDGDASVLNSTFSENVAVSMAGNANGGAIAVRAKGSLDARHVTVAENKSDKAGGIAAGPNTDVWLYSSVVAHSKGDDCDIAGAFSTETSIDTDKTCKVKWTDAKLEVKPLDDNGGPTHTRVILFEEQDFAQCFDSEDQRDEPRNVDAGCEPGAVELE